MSDVSTQELQILKDAVASGNRNLAVEKTQLLINSGASPQTILDEGLVAGMKLIGQRFMCNEAFVPELLISARAMNSAIKLLEPLLVQTGSKARFTALIGTVNGDLHDIGKNLVTMMWRGANIKVIDLGVNVSADSFIIAAREHQPKIIGLSGLLTTTMPSMRDTVAALKSAKLNGARIVVGGAPITRAFADEIGADGFAPDAASAVDMALSLAEDTSISS